MREDAVYTAKYVGEMTFLMLARYATEGFTTATRAAAMRIAVFTIAILGALVVGAGSAQGQTAGEVLGGCESVCGPVERVAAVIYSAAGFGRVVYCAQVLPLRGAHLGAGGSGAGRGVGEKGGHYNVYVLYKEATELIEPERAVYVLGHGGEERGRGAGYGLCDVEAWWVGVVVVKSFEVLR